jgi:hypothetical protein
MIPEHGDGPTGNRIQLRASTIQNHVGEQGVENVQHDNPDQHREESMTVTVDITAPKPILSSTEAASPTAEESIAAQHRGGLFAAIGMISHIHIRNTICLLWDHYTPEKAFYEYEERLILYGRKAASLLHHRPFHPEPVQTGPSILLPIIIEQ